MPDHSNILDDYKIFFDALYDGELVNPSGLHYTGVIAGLLTVALSIQDSTMNPERTEELLESISQSVAGIDNQMGT